MNQHEILDALKLELVAQEAAGYLINMDQIGIDLNVTRQPELDTVLAVKDSSTCLCAIGAHLLGKRLPTPKVKYLFGGDAIAYAFAESLGQPYAYGLGFLYGSANSPMELDELIRTGMALDGPDERQAALQPEFKYGYNDGRTINAWVHEQGLQLGSDMED